MALFDPSTLIAVCLVILALAHSWLGEVEVLRPLFTQDWREPGPRWAMQRVLRFAWHLTSLAWLALAALALGASLGHVLAIFGTLSAALVFVMLRGHLAWPLFLVVGLAGLRLAGALSSPLLAVAAFVAALIASVAAGWHFFWALGGRRGFDVAIPQREGKAMFRPPPWITAGVGVALSCFAALLVWVVTAPAPAWAITLLDIALVIFVVRAIGDGRRVGFSKRDHESAFGRWDDALFTPLVVALALGTAAARLL